MAKCMLINNYVSVHEQVCCSCGYMCVCAVHVQLGMHVCVCVCVCVCPRVCPFVCVYITMECLSLARYIYIAMG